MEIRPAVPADAAAIAAIYAPYVTDSAVSFEIEPPSVEEMQERIASAHTWLVTVEDGEVVGYAYAAPFHRRPAYRWSVEVSIYLKGEQRRKGMGRSLLTALLDDVTSRGFVNAFAGTTLPNEGSVRLFESFGFERIALQRRVGFKLGEWHDVGWWQKQLREPPVPPEEPG